MCISSQQEMNIWSLLLTLVILHKRSSSYMMSSQKLLCFSEPKGDAIKDCDKSRGFKTCFTRYDNGGLVTGRGCSTKRSSYKKCEIHSFGKISQKFCYCSRTMCNPSNMVSPSPLLTLSTTFLLLPVLLSLTASLLSNSTLAMISLCYKAGGLMRSWRRKRRRRIY